MGEFGKLLRVTSDSRPWPSGGRLAQCRACGLIQKILDTALASEINTIYKDYDLYFQGSGNEQKVFIDGIGRPRSKLLLEHFFKVVDYVDSLARPRWLDFGCGKGNLLRTMSKEYANWMLIGADLSEKNRKYIEEIPNVEDYISGGIDSIDGSYDVISISHVLEHIPRPKAFLQDIRAHIKADGHLLVAVPNWESNPFDLLVADHCLHFSIPFLADLIATSGFEVVHLDAKVIPKELIVIARPKKWDCAKQVGIPSLLIEEQWMNIVNMILWLASLVEWGRLHTRNGTAALFGTALAATWLDQACQSKFGFFVDEDADRATTTYLGRPVFLPANTPTGANVLVPLPGDIAEKICGRLNDSKNTYLSPPSIIPTVSLP